MRLLLPWLCACGVACGSLEPTVPSGPSVLLVTLDATRADRIGAYGYPMAATPTLDALAQNGTLFTRAYATQPLTLPSHASLMTGRVPPSHGVRDNGSTRLPESAVTLAEQFQAAGWHTLAFTSAFSTHHTWGFNQGFDHYSDVGPRLTGQRDWELERAADVVVNDAIDALDELDEPVFAWVHLFDPHWPYSPPEPWASEHADNPYDGELAFADAQLGRLLRWWQASHPDSIVAVTADHGEGLGDGGEHTHGLLLHDATIRVPLLLSGPGVPADTRVAEPVSHIDLAPTLLSLAGLATPPEMQGRDLRDGGTDTPYSEAMAGHFGLGLAPLAAWTDAQGRYTEGRFGAWYPVHVDRVTTQPYGQDLTAHSEKLSDLLAGFEARSGQATSLDPDALEMLSALGYVAGGDLHPPTSALDPREVVDVLPLVRELDQRLNQGLLSRADSLLRRLDSRLPPSWGLIQLQARRAARGAEPQAAEQRYEAWFDISPSGTLALQLAALADQRDEPAESERWYRQALTLQPDSSDALAGLTRSLIRQGRTAEAWSLAQVELDGVPSDAESALMQAELLLEQGLADRAMPYALRARSLEPWSSWAHAVVGRVHWERGEVTGALDNLRDAVTLAPLDVRVRLHLVDCLSEIGRHDEAVRLLAPMVHILPDHAPLARRLEQEQRASEATRTRSRRPGTGYISIKGLK